MIDTTLVVAEGLHRELLEATRHELETAAVLLAMPVLAADRSLRLLATEIHWVPDAGYEVREPDRLTINSGGYVPALSRAELLGAVPLWIHTHPGQGSEPRPSHHDHVVDGQLADVFRLRAGSEFYGSLILALDAGNLTFTGRLISESDERRIDRLLMVGSRLSLTSSKDRDQRPLAPLFDRNVRAFGGAVQACLDDLRVAVVGCGGTGSAVVEQLVRLGVRHFKLFDPDELSDSNVTRVYGSTLHDVGRAKVEVLSSHLRSIAPDALIETHLAMITGLATARHLSSVDVVFGCSDDNAGRLVLSRLATYLMVPVIDCGVLLSSDGNGTIDGIDGRVTVLHPGAACLVCRGRVDLARAGTELLTPHERARRVDEGYAPALAGIEPAVVTFTTAVAAAAVSELLERLTAFGPEPVPNEILLRLHDREISTNRLDPRPGHYCDPAAGKIGAGAAEPFLGQTWPT